MLVDDERLVRSAVQRVVEALGHDVLVARDGDHAIAVAKGHLGAIDVLLTDLVMPGPSGLDVAEAMQALQPGLRVLIMSGHVEPHRLSALVDSGHELLRKPFFEADLERALAKLR